MKKTKLPLFTILCLFIILYLLICLRCNHWRAGLKFLAGHIWPAGPTMTSFCNLLHILPLDREGLMLVTSTSVNSSTIRRKPKRSKQARKMPSTNQSDRSLSSTATTFPSEQSASRENSLFQKRSDLYFYTTIHLINFDVTFWLSLSSDIVNMRHTVWMLFREHLWTVLIRCKQIYTQRINHKAVID